MDPSITEETVKKAREIMRSESMGTVLCVVLIGHVFVTLV